MIQRQQAVLQLHDAAAPDTCHWSRVQGQGLKRTCHDVAAHVRASDAGHATLVVWAAQAHWCQRLITGEKGIELRTYALPEELLGACGSAHTYVHCCAPVGLASDDTILFHHRAGRRVWLLASGGVEGVAALGDSVEAGTPLAQIVSPSCLPMLAWTAEPFSLSSKWTAGRPRQLAECCTNSAGGVGDIRGVQVLQKP